MPTIDRRNFIKLALGSAMASLIASEASAATTKKRSTPKYDLTYMWHNDLESILDYKEVISDAIGGTNSRKLRIVRGAQNYGLIENLNLEKKIADRLAKRRSQELTEAGFEPAVAIEDSGYEQVYNVSYGKGPNLDELKTRFGIVHASLGKDLGRDLVIERVGNEYALVYHRRGDEASTLEAAARHKRILAPQKIPASIIAEDNNKTVYHEADYINSTEIEPELETRIKPQRTSKSKQKQADLDEKMEALIKNLRNQGTLKGTDKVSFYVYDLKTDQEILSINEGAERQCASMFKPYVAMGIYQKVKENKIKNTPKIQSALENMIIFSSNQDTNYLMKQLGGPKGVQKIINQYDEIFSGTRIVEYIPASGRTYKNKSTATDYARFMQAIWDNELPGSKEIRRLMAASKYNRVFLPHKMASGTAKYTKTGTTGHLVGDFGIIAPKTKTGERHPYVVVGIVERPEKKGANWYARGAKTIRAASAEIYQYMKQKYGLV